jgi:hypothetical protein
MNDTCSPCTLKVISTLRSPKGRTIMFLILCDRRHLSLPISIPVRMWASHLVATGYTISEPAVNDKQYWSLKITFSSCKGTVGFCPPYFFFYLSLSC